MTTANNNPALEDKSFGTDGNRSDHGWIVASGVGLLVSGCAAAPSALNPQGPSAAEIANLAWFMFILGGLVWLFEVVLLLVGLARRRRGTLTEPPGTASRNTWVIVGGIIIPAIILIVLYAFTLRTLNSVPAASAAQPG